MRPCAHADPMWQEGREPFGVVGISYRTAPLELRGQLGMDDAAAGAFLAKAVAHGVRECLVLSTCNRLEVYYAGGSATVVVDLLCEQSGLDHDILSAHLYVKQCGCAACHAFHVASGLDSAVVGESEIVAQIKAAWAHAKAAGTGGALLDLVIQRSLEASKRVRTETDVCRAVTSTTSLAVRAIQDRLGNLAGRRVLVIGAGETGSRVVAGLVSRHADVVVVNRTRERAASVAAERGVASAPWSSLEQEIAGADAIVCATTAAGILGRELLTRTLGGRAIPIVDMGVPANVESGVAGVDLVDIDHLTTRCADNQRAREEALVPALAVLDEELARFHVALAERTAAPTIRAIVAQGEAIRERNVEWARERLGNLDPKEMRVVEEMARRMLIGFLANPIDSLKGDLSSREHRDVVERLFGVYQGERPH